MSTLPETLPAAPVNAAPADIAMQPASAPQNSGARLLLELLVCSICGLILTWPFRSYDGSLPSFVVLAPVLWIVANQRRGLHAALCAAGFALTWTMLCFSFLWPLTVGGGIAL